MNGLGDPRMTSMRDDDPPRDGDETKKDDRESPPRRDEAEKTPQPKPKIRNIVDV